MQLLPENSWYVSPVDLLEQNINNKVLTKNISDVIEVTYAYKNLKDWTNWNTTLFNKLIWNKSNNVVNDIINNKNIFFLWKKNFWNKWKFNERNESFNHKKITLLEVVWEKAELELNHKIWEIDFSLDELNNLGNLNEDENIKKELLISSLKYARNNLEMALIWLPFELEKAWVNIDLSDEEVEDRVKKIENLEVESFWWKISENPKEMEMIYEFMKSNFDEFKSNLSIKERNEYKDYLFKIEDEIKSKTNYEFWYDYKKPKVNKKTHDALKLEMWRDDYKKIFESIPKIMSSDKEVEVSDQYWSFFDWDKWYIPGNEKYEKKSLQYILSTAVHEAFHLTTEMLWKENVDWTRWGWYLEREEWMAVYLEYLIKWEESLVWLWEPRLLVWELFEWKETEKFIELHNKLNPARASWNILRNKRNYPMNYKWWQHKDSSYWRWLRQIKEILEWENKNDISKKSLFMGKMNFDFLKKHWDNYKANIPKKVLYPFIMAEMMKFYSMKYYDSKKQWNEYKFNWKDFKVYMNNNYSSVDLEWLNIEDNEFFLEKNESWKRIGWIINGTKKLIKEVIDSGFENKKAA